MLLIFMQLNRCLLNLFSIVTLWLQIIRTLAQNCVFAVIQSERTLQSSDE